MPSRLQRSGLTLAEVVALLVILAILAAAIWPYIKKAMRTRHPFRNPCMNNLNQIGKAMAGYLADYGGYYPVSSGLPPSDFDWCKPNRRSCVWREKRFHPAGSRGVYERPYCNYGAFVRDGRTNTTLRLDHEELAHNYRTIGLGVKSDGATSPMGFSVGQFNNAPVGLGMLLGGGYMTDSMPFYCPAAMRRKMPSDRNGDQSEQAGAFLAEHWTTAGGIDSVALRYGDWSETSFDNRTNVIYSSYSYRNTPLAVKQPWHRYDEDQATGELKLPGTEADIRARIGRPLWPTGRLLAGRAIVMDTFSKGGTYDATGRDVRDIKIDSAAETVQIAGMGKLGHGDGYNILYGDYRVAWFADPFQTVIWSPQTLPRGVKDGVTHGGPFHTFAYNAWYGWASPVGESKGEGDSEGTSHFIWHLMDRHSAFDLDF